MLILDAAKAMYFAVGAAQGNKAQCVFKERVERMLVGELQRLPKERRDAFAASPAGRGLLSTLESAVALCGEFGQRDWFSRVFSADKHAASHEEIRGDSVVKDALTVALRADEQRDAAHNDALEARRLVSMLRQEQRADFENLNAGQGERESAVPHRPALHRAFLLSDLLFTCSSIIYLTFFALASFSPLCCCCGNRRCCRVCKTSRQGVARLGIRQQFNGGRTPS